MKRSLQLTKLFLIPLLFALEANSQTTFVHRVGSSHSDFGMSCSPAADGGFIVAMESATNGMDLHSGLVKTDANGVMQWYKLYQVGDYTYPYTVLQAKDEGFIVLAVSSDSSYVNNFMTLYKTSLSGVTQWNKQYSFSNNDIPLNLVHRKAGGYISFSLGDWNLGTFPHTIVTTYDDSCNVIWSKKFSVPFGLNGARGIEMPDSNICLIASTGDPQNNFFLDVIVIMLDPSGNILWKKNLGTYYDDEPYAIATNQHNEIFITGRSYFMNREWDSFLIRLDQSGNVMSTRVYDGGTTIGEIMRCIVAYDDGSCKLLGDMGTFDERDMTLINIDSNASVASAKRYPFSPMFTNYALDLFQASDGGLVFTGDYRPPSALRDAILVKTDHNGNLNCFVNNPAITEYNELFHDKIIQINTAVVIETNLNFPANVPVNPFFDHVVCALSADVNENESIVEFNLYPSPAMDFLKFEFSVPHLDMKIEIYNPEGRLVFIDDEISAGSLALDLTGFSSGIYLARCVTGDKSVERKFVISK